jgi:beta-glucosidase
MRMVMCGKLTEADVDARAQNVLVLLKRAIQSGIPFDFPFEEEYHHLNLPHLDTTYTRGLLRRAAAASTILLKNERGLLPIRAGIKKIAVFGLHADMHFASGGGAASVHRHTFVSTPLDAIKEAAKEIGAEVEYSIGSEGYLYVPYAHRYLQHPDGLPASEAVIKLEFWKEQPSPDWKSRDAAHVSVSGKPDYVLHFDSAKCFMEDGLPKDIQNGARFVRVR